MLAVAADRERGNDRQGQRKLEMEAGSLARLARHRDGAADTFEVGAYDIHTDAPAGDRADLGCSGKARLEDELEFLRLRHLLDFGLAVDACCNSLFRQAVDVDAIAVVGHEQADLVARLARGEAHQAYLALALLEPVDRLFDPVVDGVADDVGQRVANHLDHLAVEFHFAAFEIDHDLLAKLVRQVADEARERGEQVLEALHPHPRDRGAHIGKDC